MKFPLLLKTLLLSCRLVFPSVEELGNFHLVDVLHYTNATIYLPFGDSRQSTELAMGQLSSGPQN